MMKFDRVLGILLSILVVIMILVYNNSNKLLDNQSSFGLISDNGTLNDNIYEYTSQIIDKDNTKSEEILEFYNKENYSVTINSNFVSIACKGSTNEENEMVENHYKVNATFSKEKNGSRSKSLLVKPKEKIYIYINSDYDSELFPTNEVTCNYSFNINASL